MSGSFLGDAQVTADVQAMYDEDLADDGFIWNVSRLWAHQPGLMKELFTAMSSAFHATGMELRQRGILVTAMASTLGDSYCSLAWGGKLSGFEGSDSLVAAGVLSGTDAGLTDQEKAMADWARKIVRDPNATTAADVQQLRAAGLTDQQIFGVTAFVALRLAFSAINDALGAAPDVKLVDKLPPDVVAAVSYGRPPVDGDVR